MMSKIQNLNGTHNYQMPYYVNVIVVYDVKDTKFEWNSQLGILHQVIRFVVYDVKDTKFEWNSQRSRGAIVFIKVVYDVKDTKFEWNSQLSSPILTALLCCL